MEFVNECITALDSYALRSFGIGERGLPGSTLHASGSCLMSHCFSLCLSMAASVRRR